jgi:hypothetical protein
MNSDLLMLAELGEHRKPPGDRPPPDLRRRVLSGAVRPRPARRPLGVRLAWQLGTLATAAAAVLAVTVLSGQTTPPVGHAPPPVAAPKQVDAAQVLTLAAQRVTAEPATVARPDQYVFVESVIGGIVRIAKEPDPPAERPVYRLDSVKTLDLRQEWRSVDGVRDGLARSKPYGSGGAWDSGGSLPGCRNGQSRRTVDRPGHTEACTPMPADRAGLPTDADAMLAHLYRPGDDDVPGDYPSADQRAFARVSVVLGQSLLAPAVQAAAFQAASRIPGVTVLRGVVDAAGRTGTAVTRTERAVREELIFDPTAYRYLGAQATVVDPAAFDSSSGALTGLHAGDQIAREAIVRVAVVDRPGQQP